MNIFTDLMDKTLFTAGLLGGAQMPNFVAQYRQRIEGHWDESKRQLGEYQQLADKYHEGDLQALVTAHLNSDMPVFQDEGRMIEALATRTEYLADRVAALETDAITLIQDLVLNIDVEIAKATAESLTPAMPINEATLICGLSVALLMTYVPRLTYSAVKLIGRLTRRVKVVE